MSCWCGHGPWHHYTRPYPPAYYPPPEYYGPQSERHRTGTEEEPADILRRLEEQIAGLRRDLDDLRRSGGSKR